MSIQNKKHSLTQQHTLKHRIQDRLLLRFWERLKTVTELALYANTRSNDTIEWNRSGKGIVQVIPQSDLALTFHEIGEWQVQDPYHMTFRNAFRWTLDRGTGVIALEHMRLGPDHPVLLVHLALKDTYHLASIEPHLCKKETYSCHVFWDQQHIRLSWKMMGPTKHGEIDFITREQWKYYIILC